MSEIRVPRRVYEEMLSDLRRPHPIALERGGFAFGKLADEGSTKPLVLLYKYEPLREDDYLESEGFAACFSGDAIRRTMQYLRDRRGTKECAFHVHLHEHQGMPGFSRPDMRGLPPMIPSFCRAAGNGAHGMILLSEDRGSSLVWLPGQPEPQLGTHLTVVGKPLQVWVNEYGT